LKSNAVGKENRFMKRKTTEPTNSFEIFAPPVWPGSTDPPPPESVPNVRLEDPPTSLYVSAGVTSPDMTTTIVATPDAQQTSHPGFAMETYVPVIQTPHDPQTRSSSQLKGILCKQPPPTMAFVYQQTPSSAKVELPAKSAPRTSDEIVSQLAQTLMWPHTLKCYGGQQARSLRIGANEEDPMFKAVTYPLAVLVSWLRQASEVVGDEDGIFEGGNTETMAKRYSDCLAGLGDCEELLPLLQDPYLNAPDLRHYLTQHIERIRALAQDHLGRL
jgi:hypothetical protein